MKRAIRFIPFIIIIAAVVAYGVHWAFFDIQRIHGGVLMQEMPAPSGGSTVIAYSNNGGATTDFAVLCAVKDNQSGKQRNIYWNYPCTDARGEWIDEETVVINGKELDVWKDIYDYRNDS